MYLVELDLLLWNHPECGVLGIRLNQDVIGNLEMVLNLTIKMLEQIRNSTVHPSSFVQGGSEI